MFGHGKFSYESLCLCSADVDRVSGNPGAVEHEHDSGKFYSYAEVVRDELELWSMEDFSFIFLRSSSNSALVD